MAPTLRALIGAMACAGAAVLAACSDAGDDGEDGGAGAPSDVAGADGAGSGAGTGAGTNAGAGAGAGRSGAGGASGTAGNTPSGGSGGSAGASGGDAGTMPGDAGEDDAGGALTNPAPGEYGRRAELLEANSEMAVAELDGKIYVLGGYPSSREVQTTVQIYDPASDSWALGPPLPIALHHPVVVGVAGKLYSFGGQTTGDADTDRTLVYDPSGEPEWLDLEPMPTARGAGAAAVIGDVVYVAGGRPPSAGNAFEAYDIGDDAWTELEPLPDEFPDRNHLAATAIGGKVYVAGGRYSGGGFMSPLTDSLDIYDPETSMWTQGAPMLRPRGGINGVAAFGCFHTWGGEGGNTGEPNNVFPDHDVYDPIANEWTSLPDLPVPVHGVTGAAFVAGLIYMPGGGTQSGGSSGSRLFQVYRPDMRCE